LTHVSRACGALRNELGRSDGDVCLWRAEAEDLRAYGDIDNPRPEFYACRRRLGNRDSPSNSPHVRITRDVSTWKPTTLRPLTKEKKKRTCCSSAAIRTSLSYEPADPRTVSQALPPPNTISGANTAYPGSETSYAGEPPLRHTPMTRVHNSGSTPASPARPAELLKRLDAPRPQAGWSKKSDRFVFCFNPSWPGVRIIVDRQLEPEKSFVPSSCAVNECSNSSSAACKRKFPHRVRATGGDSADKKKEK